MLFGCAVTFLHRAHNRQSAHLERPTTAKLLLQAVHAAPLLTSGAFYEAFKFGPITEGLLAAGTRFCQPLLVCS